MAHTLAVLTVLGVILAGELARQAWGSLHYGACLGFWLAALVGTGLVTYNSVGRQAEASDTSTLSVEDRNGQRTEIKAQLAEHQRMLDEEQANKAAEIKRGGCGRVCQGFDASIAVYQSAVAGDEAKLAKLGPAEPVAPKPNGSRKSWHCSAPTKCRPRRCSRYSNRFSIRFCLSTGRSWLGIMRSGVVRRSVRRTFGRSKAVAGRFAATSKEEAAADLVTRLALGERFGSQDELRERYGVAKSTMSDWLKEWEANGLIPSRLQDGRRKVLAMV